MQNEYVINMLRYLRVTHCDTCYTAEGENVQLLGGKIILILTFIKQCCVILMCRLYDKRYDWMTVVYFTKCADFYND